MADYDDLIEMGFEPEEKKPKKRRKAPPKKTAKPVAPKVQVVKDSSAEVVAQAAADAIKESNATFKKALNELVAKIEPRPKKMRVDIHRNSAGFMDSFDIDVEY